MSMMIMQLYDEDGFTDEFESKVIENMVKRSSRVEWVREDADSQYFLLKKNDIEDLIREFQDEKIKQKEKSLFKKSPTKTLKELRIIINILEILKNDQVVQEDKDVVMFVIKENELLDI